jgi:hypothetical protein
MSVGPLSSFAGSVAGAPLAQTKGSEAERAQYENAVQEGRVQSGNKAESAAGIGETDGKDHETAERDADGRRPWEIRHKSKPPDAAADEAATVKDPSGQSGNLLDLSG